MDYLEYDDYKNIRRSTNMSPKEWIDLQQLYNRKVRDRLFHKAELKVFSCKCRSPWCKQCAKTCKTMETIRERLLLLDWRRTRQIVLTVSRETPPEQSYDTIARNRSISKLVKSLELAGCHWLWVLEFHIGGFPHWHLFIETAKVGRAGMIGKSRIQQKWRKGLVWETFAHDLNHWQAICGYHRKTGYFASEKKQHQLELPNYLQNRSRVRKFASNYGTIPVKRAKNISKKEKGCSREQKTYSERLKTCNKTCKVCKAGGWLDLPVSGAQVRAIAEDKLDMIDYKTYRGSDAQTMDVILESFKAGINKE
jgi:hypothetical protein